MISFRQNINSDLSAQHIADTVGLNIGVHVIAVEQLNVALNVNITAKTSVRYVGQGTSEDVGAVQIFGVNHCTAGIDGTPNRVGVVSGTP